MGPRDELEARIEKLERIVAEIADRVGVRTGFGTGSDTGIQSEIAMLLQQGKKLEAVKLFRERTSAGLKEAKEAVEAVERGMGLR